MNSPEPTIAAPMLDVLFKKAFLSPAERAQIISTADAIVPVSFIPKTRFGSTMNLRMNCLGKHWSARDYKYHDTRVDVDGQPCPPIPDQWQAVARRALLETNYLAPDEYRPYELCVINRYSREGGKLGDHVDNSESEASLQSGYPIVSLSIGASCIFRLGGLKRTDPYEQHVIDSGELLIFGRTMRLAYHGVKKILPSMAPTEPGLADGERVNITFRRL